MTSTASDRPELEALRRTVPSAPAPRSGLWRRLGVVALVLGVLVTAFAALRPVLFPPRTVKVAGVQPIPAGTELARSTSGGAVQDVGWIEPYRFPTTARPLVHGVLKDLRVLEGQVVKEDDTILAVLENPDLVNAQAEAEAAAAAATAARAEIEAEWSAAKRVLTQNLEARRIHADVTGKLAAALRDIARLQAAHLVATARADEARIEVEAQERLETAGGKSRIALERARAAHKARRAEVDVAVADVARARAEAARQRGLLVIAQEGVDKPEALASEVEHLAAKVKAAIAAEKAAEVRAASARTLVSHLTVRAPRDGVVMRLESAPGAVVGPGGEYKESAESGPGSTSRLNRMTGGLVSIYDPAELQLRVDVLFAQVDSITRDSDISFTVDAIPGKTFHARFDRFVHESDLNQNALQVKLRVKDPDPRMRPEMLCRVAFRTKSRDAGPTSTSTAVRVPSEAVRDGAVFVIDPRGGGKARKVAVEVLSTADGVSTVRGNLGVSNQVILDVVEDGESVRTDDDE